MLFDNKGASQRDHHEDPQQATETGYQHDSRQFKVVAKNHHRGHGNTDPKSDGFAGRACGLNDIVFENRGAREAEFVR